MNRTVSLSTIILIVALVILAVILFGCGRDDQSLYEEGREGVTKGAEQVEEGTAEARRKAEGMAGEPARETVEITEGQWQPENLTVEAGTTVEFVNRSGQTRELAAGTPQDPEGLFDEELDQDEKFTYTFDEPGTYEYYDKNNEGVEGTIKVEPAK